MDSVRNQSRSLLSPRGLETSTSRSHDPHRQWYIVFFIVATLLIAGGTIIWVLNILGILPGPWSSVFGAIFTGLGIIVALLDSVLTLVGVDGRQR